MAGGGAAGIGGGLAAGAASAVLLRVWLSSSPRTSSSGSTCRSMHALADADNLAAYCRGTGRCPAPGGAQGHRGPARRRPQEGRRQPRPGDLGRRGAARRTTPQDQRGLRHADHRRPDARSNATSATPSTPTTGSWPTSRPRPRPSPSSSTRSTGRSRSRSGPDTRRRGRRWPRPGTRASGNAALEVDAVEREAAGYCPRWDDPGLAVACRCPATCRRRSASARSRSTCGDLPGGISADPRLMEGVPHAVHAPRAAAVPAPRPTC